MTRELEIIALTPAAWTGRDFYPGIAIAAAKAGACGVLDLEYLESANEAMPSLELLLASAADCGIKCDITQLELFEPLLQKLAACNKKRKLIILTSALPETIADQKKLKKTVSRLKNLGLSCFMQVLSPAEAALAQQSGFEAVIAKGNESGGLVAEENSFVLLQILKAELDIPVYLQGGIGIYSAAAAAAGGASGLVLDSQLLLTRESPLSLEQKEKLAAFDGTETAVFNNSSCSQRRYRIYCRPGTASLDGSADFLPLLKSAARNSAGRLPEYLACGQDAAFAAALARKYLSVAALIQALREQVKESLTLAAKQGVLLEGSPLAAANGTRFPILQGAMTRVSDCSEFAHAVADAGGLPFMALALMRKDEVETLLASCKENLGTLSWGVGMLGFVPPELRQEQLEVVLKYRPPFALIAGGRPDQAKELESLGIKTYLHVPSPSLLVSFIEMGARKFILEGRECGGHVGPRSSFVLWECMIDTLLETLPPKADPGEFQFIFAGGIHDSKSAAMLAAMAAPLAGRGVKIGILMGTAYLFTEEAVSSGAIVPRFQEAAIACKKTVLLETGPGHAIRCLESPYKEAFDQKRSRLEAEGMDRHQLRTELELLNLGRLRVASKGLARVKSSAGSKLEKVSDKEQWDSGMYMIGQVAALHETTMKIADLHRQVSEHADAELKALSLSRASFQIEESEKPQNEPIAIVGMSCLFPKANDLESYWQNILNGVDCIEEIPRELWDFQSFYSDDPLARDKIFSKWGGFLRDIPFDPAIYGIPPSSLASVDPMQLLILEVTRAALADAGYQNRKHPTAKTSVVLANAGHGPITAFYSLRSMLDWTLKDMDPEYRKVLEERLPEWTEDSFPGYLGNVVAGRVANRFDLGGINFCVDAACASSLAAMYIGVRELRAGASDMVLLASTDTHNQPGDYLSFSKTHALSGRGRCRTFDAGADGIVISEGMAVLVLKRLKDAERDGDRIYAVVRGIGGSSDGRDLSLTAPRPAGQMLALERAYEDAGISPATVELVEAHGTGTVAGDRAEVEALRNIFESADAPKRGCAIGSVKTMIGHSKCSAGLASVIKVAKALYHKVLPPTLHVEQPNPACKFEDSPFYVNSQTRPWLSPSAQNGRPRRAGVSAFGFGGTNFHTVLEEYQGQKLPRQSGANLEFPSELFVLRAASRKQLLKNIESLIQQAVLAQQTAAEAKGPLGRQEASSLLDLAYKQQLLQSNFMAAAASESSFNLAVVAASIDDLIKKLEQTSLLLNEDENKTSIKDPRGIYFAQIKTGQESDCAFGKTAFLFPGQGSQHPNMLRDLVLNFAAAAEKFELADRILAGKHEERLSRYVFPLAAFTEDERGRQAERLTNTHLAQPAVAAADLAAFSLLKAFGIKADYCAGHSFGEYAALAAAGVLSEEDLLLLAEQRGRILNQANEKCGGGMIAVTASSAQLSELLSECKGISLANVNSPKQCIVAGSNEALEQASKLLAEKKLRSRTIAVSAAFHSPLMQTASKEFAELLKKTQFRPAQIPVYSNTLAQSYPNDASEMIKLLSRHIVEPVQFQKQIEKMYEDGARIFIECGPGAVLTGLVDDILAGKEDYQALSLERSARHGITQLQHLLAQLFICGFEADFAQLYKHRLESPSLRVETQTAGKKPGLRFLVNGSHIKRLDGKKIIAANRPTQNSYDELASEPAIASAAAKQKQQSAPLNQAPLARLSAAASAGQQHLHDASPAPASGSATARAQAQAANMKQPPAAKPAAAAPSASAPRDRNGINPAQLAAREKIMLEFQKNLLEMSSLYLETQEKVMLAFLEGRNTGEPAQARSALASPSVQAAAPRLPQSRVPHKQLAESKAPEPASKAADGVTLDEALPKASEAAEVSVLKKTGLDSEFLIGKLLEIVSERTGYPAEMLDPSLDLEADLGIDSIKRVEILNNFRKLLDDNLQEGLESGIEKLAGIKTLQGIFDWIRSDMASFAEAAAVESQQAAVPVSEKQHENNSGSIPAVPLARALLRSVELPQLLAGKVELDGLYIVTDSGDKTTYDLLAKIQSAGARTLLLQHRQNAVFEKLKKSQDRAEINLLSEKQVGKLAAQLKNDNGKIAGIVHLLPLRADFAELWQALDSEEPQLCAGSLFLLCREFLGARSESGIRVVSASQLNGAFGLSESGKDPALNPLLAGVSGVIKSLAREYPDHLLRALDFKSDLSGPERALEIFRELANDDRTHVEVGYSKNKRIGLEAYEAPLAKEEASKGHFMPELDGSSLILVTGGARGITAEICLELAEKHKPTFVIVGRAQRPSAREVSSYAGLNTARELKSAIMSQLKAEGKAVTVPAVEAIYQKLLREREIRENLGKIEASGARVQYFSLDLQNREAFIELIDKLYESFGKIDAVIHGAGVIEDAYLQDKSLESFERVFRTKIDPALVLARHLQFDCLKYLVFFSSIVGRTGNAGQSDYVAANETLNKLAILLNSKSNARVMSLAWGPWRGGMAQSELESLFARFGWSMIESKEGRKSFYEELSLGDKKSAEVILLAPLASAQTTEKNLRSEDRNLAGSDHAKPEQKSGNGSKNAAGNGNGNGNGNGHESAAAGYLKSRGARLNRAEVIEQSQSRTALRLQLDPEFDLYLKDHAFDGTPVLPMAVACELMAEAAQMIYPQLSLSSLENMQIPQGIMFDGSRPKNIFIELESTELAETRARVQISLSTNINSLRKNFKVEALLSKSAADLPENLSEFSRSAFSKQETSRPDRALIYGEWLFHGPLFQGIQEVTLIAQDGICGNLASVPLSDCLADTGLNERWLLDPLLLDSAMQLAGVWARRYMDITALPTGFRRLQVFSAPQAESFAAVVKIRHDSGKNQLTCDLCIFDQAGRLQLYMEGLGGVGSKAFNRLAQQSKPLSSER